MTIRLNCDCGQRINVPDNAAGRRVKCPKCKKPLQIRQPRQPGTVAEPSATPSNVPPPLPGETTLAVKPGKPASASTPLASSPTRKVTQSAFIAAVAVASAIAAGVGMWLVMRGSEKAATENTNIADTGKTDRLKTEVEPPRKNPQVASKNSSNKSNRPSPRNNGKQVTAKKPAGSRTGGGNRGLTIIDDPSAPPKWYRGRYAVIIGINDYSGRAGLPKLQFATNDATAVRDILQEEYGFKKQHVKFLADADATQQSIRDAFQNWLSGKNLTKDDAVVVFFAGHGLLDGKDGYLAAVDSKANDLKQSCVPVAWIRSRMERLTCRHKLILLDSCYSGSLFTAAKRTGPIPVTPAKGNGGNPNSKGGSRGVGGSKAASADNFAYYLNRPAFVGISAGRATPVADGLGKERHSVFTSNLLRVLRERADSSRKDQAFTFRQLAVLVEFRVTTALKSRQIPDWGRLGPGDGDFIFRPTVFRTTPTELAAKKLYVQNVRAAHKAWEDGQDAVTILNNREIRAEHRGWEWYYLMQLSNASDGLIPLKSRISGGRFMFSRDGTRIATAGSNQIGVLDRSSGKPICTIAGHKTPKKLPMILTGIYMVSFSFTPDGKHVVSAGMDGKCYLWDANTGKRVREFLPDPPTDIKGGDEPRQYQRLAVSPDGKLVAAITGQQQSDSAIGNVWEISTGKAVKSLGEVYGRIGQMAFSADSSRVAVGSRPIIVGNYGVRVFFARENGKGSVVAKTAAKGALSVAFSPDRTQMATGSTDSNITIWNVKTGAKMAQLTGHTGPIHTLSYSSDGRRLLSVSSDRSVRIWERTGFKFRMAKKIPGTFAVFTPDGRNIAMAGSGGIKLFNLVPATEAVILDCATNDTKDRRITDIAFSADGLKIATGCEGRVECWNPETGKRLNTWLSSRGQSGINTDVEGLSFSSDGKWLTFSGLNQYRYLIDANTGKARLNFKGQLFYKDAAFIPGTRHIISGHDFRKSPRKTEKPSLFVYDIAPMLKDIRKRRFRDKEFGLLKTVFNVNSASTDCIAVSQDGRLVAAGGWDKSVEVWDMRTWKRLHRFDSLVGAIRTLSFSRDGKRLAGAARGLYVWDLETGATILKQPTVGTYAIALNDDGSRVAIAGYEGVGSGRPDARTRIIDTKDGVVMFNLQTKAETCWSIAFSPDSRRLALGGNNGKVTIWDAGMNYVNRKK